MVIVGVPTLTTELETVNELFEPLARLTAKAATPPATTTAATTIHFLLIRGPILAVVRVMPGESSAERSADGAPGLISGDPWADAPAGAAFAVASAGAAGATGGGWVSLMYWNATMPARACSFTAVIRIRNFPPFRFNWMEWMVARPAASVIARSVRKPFEKRPLGPSGGS